MQEKDQPNSDTHPRSKETVLIVDDDEGVRNGLVWALNSDYHVLEAGSRHEALRLLQREKIEVVVSDLHLPPHPDDFTEGLAIIEAARDLEQPVQVVVITGSNSRHAALEAVKRGAYGFFEKPVDADEVLHIVNQAARMRRLELENDRLRQELVRARGFGRLIGSSKALEDTLKQARAVAGTNATVLIVGENGTGKEMVARAIHEESPRSNEKFIAVSCAALPETLIESELFGHEKGAFTNATNVRMGRFELADGGTLFLDEIVELTPNVQVKLLRVLQERAFERVGGTKTLTVDIRLIAAGNRDLEVEVEAGRFRRDLFYRLNVVPLELPPLRKRKDDIPILAAHFAAKAAEKHGRPIPQLAPELIDCLHDYEWPGNIRELENLMERLVLLDRGATIGLEFLPVRMLQTAPAPIAPGEMNFENSVSSLKHKLVVDALKAENGSRVAAARRLGISRSYLHRLISEFGIAPAE